MLALLPSVLMPRRRSHDNPTTNAQAASRSQTAVELAAYRLASCRPEDPAIRRLGKGGAVMTIEDKTFVLNILQLPRLGLNQKQIGDIERVIDGRPSEIRVVAVPCAKAAEMLGFTSKNSVKTIEKYVRIGKLTRSSPGRVTLESVENLGKEVAA